VLAASHGGGWPLPGERCPCTALGFWDTGLNLMLPLWRVEAGSGGTPGLMKPYLSISQVVLYVLRKTSKAWRSSSMVSKVWTQRTFF